MPAKSIENNGLKKRYLKTRHTCKVTFRLPALLAKGIEHANLVGDFNGWNEKANPMRRLKNGEHTVTIELKPGCEYQFRYLLNSERWVNDPGADKLIPGPFHDALNSVIIV